MKRKLSVIIPAYNEEDRIIHTLTETLEYLNEQDYASQVLVVSDGSTDSTASVVNRFDGGRKVDLKVMEYFPNRGKGFAVRFGMLSGDAEILMFMDADYSVDIREVQKGMRLLDAGADIAMASRSVPGAVVSRHQNKARELSAKLYTLVQSLYLGIYFKDTQCGFKLFRRNVAKDLFARQKLHSVIFDPEILWLGVKSGYRVAEFPVKWQHMEDSRIQYTSFRKSLFVFEELFRIRGLHRREGGQ